jgi:hypothetical protein
MALTTKAELREAVKLRFPRTDKDDLINDVLDQVLKTAVRAHKFTDIIAYVDATIADGDSSATLSCSNFGVPVLVFLMDGTASRRVRIQRLTELLVKYPDLSQWQFSDIPECYFTVSSGVATINFPAVDATTSLRIYYYKRCALVDDTDVNPIQDIDAFLVNQTIADCYAAIRDFEAAALYATRAGQEFKNAVYDDVTKREHRQFAEFKVMEEYTGCSPWYDPFVKGWN